MAIKYPVELLRDKNGVYGIGIAKQADIECPPSDLLLRRDRLNESGFVYAALQMIPHDFRYTILEEQLREVILEDMLRREEGSSRYQLRTRQVYYGLKLASRSIINGLICKALEEAACPEAIKQARRFKFLDRYNIYRAAALSPRVLQIVVAFPTLALAIFGCRHGTDPDPPRWAVALVEAGAPLKTIADAMHVPMAFRKVKPGAADLALPVFEQGVLDDPRLIYAYMPDSLPRMKLWLWAINFANDFGPDFVEWTAKHCLEIAGTPNEASAFLIDTADWVLASYNENQFAVRSFSPGMSLKTVTRLSADWHEAVANNRSGPSYQFPEPWCDPGQACGYKIVPITNSADLYREGHAMHHCVGTYGDRVQQGEVYIYSVSKDEERIATVELIKHRDSILLGQLRGPCNRQVSQEAKRAVKTWLRSQ